MNQEQVKALIREEIIKLLGDYSNIPLEVQRALQANGFVISSYSSGVAKFNAFGELGVTVPKSGTVDVFVASASGGAVTRELIFTNGILTSA